MSTKAVTIANTLNLGCGFDPMPKAVNHDRKKHSPHVDISHNLDHLPWPWPASRFEYVFAFDVLEHLKLDVEQWMDELWRILAPAGALKMRLPAWDNPISYRDPTHVRVFHEETFDYWDPDKELWKSYGTYYFRRQWWWKVVTVSRSNADPRYGVGDLLFSLQKRGH